MGNIASPTSSFKDFAQTEAALAVLSREATFDIDERLRQLQQEEEDAGANFGEAAAASKPPSSNPQIPLRQNSNLSQQNLSQKPFSYLSPESPVNNLVATASESPSTAASLGGLKYQPPAVRKFSNVSSTHRLSFGSNAAAEAPAAVGIGSGGTDEGYLGSVGHSNFASTEDPANIEASNPNDLYKPLADMFSGAGGGSRGGGGGGGGGGSSYLSDFPLANSDFTDPDLLAEEVSSNYGIILHFIERECSMNVS